MWIIPSDCLIKCPLLMVHWWYQIHVCIDENITQWMKRDVTEYAAAKWYADSLGRGLSWPWKELFWVACTLTKENLWMVMNGVVYYYYYYYYIIIIILLLSLLLLLLLLLFVVLWMVFFDVFSTGWCQVIDLLAPITFAYRLIWCWHKQKTLSGMATYPIDYGVWFLEVVESSHQRIWPALECQHQLTTLASCLFQQQIGSRTSLGALISPWSMNSTIK